MSSSSNNPPVAEAAETTAAEFWDQHRWQITPLDYWASNPTIQAYINRRITGNPDLRWIDWLAINFVPQPVERGLCLACGAGTAEIHAVSINMCRAMDACDISEASLTSAREKALQLGIDSRIRHYCCDLNQEILPPDHYDLVLSSGGMHHVERLEHLVAQIQLSLKPGGLFAVDEYIGPARLQYRDAQLDVVNRIIQALPPSVRRGGSARRPPVEYMLAHDPSEAVRSDEILPLLEQHFDILEKRFYGGTLLHVLFASIAIEPKVLLPLPEASPEGNAVHADLVPLMLLIEEILTERGVLPDDYAVIVARKKS